jgi:type I restriction enzyme S subunit
MIENTLIPKNWKINRLDEVGDIVSGGTPSTKEVDNWGEEIIWITPSDLTGYLAKTIFKGKKSISKLGLSRSSARLMPKGSVLFSSRAPIGYVVIAGTELCTNQGFKSIIPNEKVTSDYLFHFLKYSKTYVQSIASGTTFKEISARAFGSLKIPVPNLNEQQQIVEKIEELFSELDAGRRQLEVVKKQLITYRQSVLKFAFEGKFTKTKFVESKTGNIVDIINNGYTPSREFLSEDFGDIPFIKVYNLNFNGTLNFKKNPTFIPKDIHKKQLKRSICLPGDVLINIVGPPLGKVSIVTDQFPEWNINQAIVMFRPNEKVISKFLSYFLQNSATINWLEETSKATAGQWNVKVSTCREIPIPICSPVEQEIVVNEIECRLSVCEKLEETIETCLQQSEVLKQSILKQAFEGKLVKSPINCK